ncbi:hypothetical protein [Solirubrobacter soli]|uniref:hypothetical protein n=1 Tax=Solirubrobacter soli TaxID=363832 RepID=UPI0012FB4B01|nr:hypothetical protein [Solirubrobacter soli]
MSVAACIAAGLLAAPQARAGSATVYQCRGPAGQLAATDMLRLPDPARLSVSVLCHEPSSGWGIQLARGSSGNWDPTTTGELVIAGPPGTSISGGWLERQIFGYLYSTAVQPSTWGFGYRLTTSENTPIERCGTAWSYEWGPQPCVATAGGSWQFPDIVVNLPPVPTPLLRIGFGCYKAGNNCQRPLSGEMLGIRRMVLRVDDMVSPVIGGVVGPLASDQPVRTRTVSINASDTGLGLYRLIVTVDGRIVETEPFSPAVTDCRDAEPTSADPYQFSSVSACPTASTSRSFVLSSLPTSGQHQVRVEVEDASGNRTAAIDRVATFELPADGLRCPTDGCVRAPPSPNGINATATARLAISGRRTISTAYGRRHTLGGRLVNASGLPIADAQLDVSELPVDSPTWRPVGQIRTDASGRFRYAVPPGTSRVIAMEYRTPLGAASVGARAQVSVRVRAGVTMSLRPARVRPGGSVRVRGRLLGTDAAARALVELQALDGREWRTFKTLPVRRGRFAYRYRFRHTAGGAQFLWRIYVRAQAGLPYAAGASRSAWVTVER